MPSTLPEEIVGEYGTAMWYYTFFSRSKNMDNIDSWRANADVICLKISKGVCLLRVRWKPNCEVERKLRFNIPN